MAELSPVGGGEEEAEVFRRLFVGEGFLDEIEVSQDRLLGFLAVPDEIEGGVGGVSRVLSGFEEDRLAAESSCRVEGERAVSGGGFGVAGHLKDEFCVGVFLDDRVEATGVGQEVDSSFLVGRDDDVSGESAGAFDGVWDFVVVDEFQATFLGDMNLARGEMSLCQMDFYNGDRGLEGGGNEGDEGREQGGHRFSMVCLNVPFTLFLAKAQVSYGSLACFFE